MAPPAPKQDDFAVSLFNCFSEPGGAANCCYVAFCTPCAYGSLVSKMPPNSTACAGNWWGGCCLYVAAQFAGSFLSACPSAWLVHFPTRAQLRREYGMTGGARGAEDCVTTWLCEPCALCQEMNEQKIRSAAGGVGAAAATAAMPPPPQAMEVPVSTQPPPGDTPPLKTA